MLQILVVKFKKNKKKRLATLFLINSKNSNKKNGFPPKIFLVVMTLILRHLTVMEIFFFRFYVQSGVVIYQFWRS